MTIQHLPSTLFNREVCTYTHTLTLNSCRIKSGKKDIYLKCVRQKKKEEEIKGGGGRKEVFKKKGDDGHKKSSKSAAFQTVV